MHVSFFKKCTHTHLDWYTAAQQQTSALHELLFFPLQTCEDTNVQTCACECSNVSYQKLQWQTAFAAGNLENLSHAAPLVAVPLCARPPTSLCFVYRKGWGLDTLHSQRRRRKNKDEIQVRSQPETRRQELACEHRAPQRCGYFWSCKGFTHWVYITGIPLVSALKRNHSSCLAELKQLSANFRTDINMLYKRMVLNDLSGLTIKAILLY